MISVIKNHFAEHFPFLNAKKLLLAVSGGMDSAVLAHICHTLGYDIALAHVNFQLRGQDSDTDETFVKSLAEQYQIPFFSTKVDTKAFAKANQASIQMAARELRYQWFDTLMTRHGFDYLLTAHHLDDSIETFVINLNRKTGLEGLTGIKEVNDKIIRPLLSLTRDKITAYTEKHQLQWREDQSNTSLKYERNHIRHKLLPVWEQINPEFKTDIQQTMAYLKENQQLIDDYLALVQPQFWSEKVGLVSINLKRLKQLSHPEVLLYHCLKPYGFTDWTAVKNLLKSQTGKQVKSDDYVLLKNRETLELFKPEQPDYSHQIVEKSFEINHVKYDLNLLTDKTLVDFSIPHTEFFDSGEIELPLHIRTWRQGDYFYPLGLSGKKKVSDFFTDQKISTREKEKIWLLCDALDQIIWIIGYRIDHRFRVTNQTKSFLKISRTP